MQEVKTSLSKNDAKVVKLNLRDKNCRVAWLMDKK